jgi:predicted alpha/beta hydrolase
MAVLWHGVMPLLTAVYGYFPASALRLGEDIPRGIAMQWAGRVSPRLRPKGRSASLSRGALAIRRCEELAASALLVTSVDDAFATVRGARRFLTYFPKFSGSHWIIDPGKMGLPRLGHFGIFRATAEKAVWSVILAYILRGTPPLGSVPLRSQNVHAELIKAAPTAEVEK